MYRKKDRMGQKEIKFVSLEDLVPQDHLLRKIDAAIDFASSRMCRNTRSKISVPWNLRL